MEISHSRETAKPRVRLRFEDPTEAQVFGQYHYGTMNPFGHYWLKRTVDLQRGNEQHIDLIVKQPRLEVTANRLLLIQPDTAPVIYPADLHLPTGAARERGFKIAHGLGRTIHDFLTPDLAELDY